MTTSRGCSSERTAALVIGDPLDPRTDIGPDGGRAPAGPGAGLPRNWEINEGGGVALPAGRHRARLS